MFKILFWLLLDSLFIRMLLTTWNELGGYKFLVLGIVALFTFEFVLAIKSLFK